MLFGNRLSLAKSTLSVLPRLRMARNIHTPLATDPKPFVPQDSGGPGFIFWFLTFGACTGGGLYYLDDHINRAEQIAYYKQQREDPDHAFKREFDENGYLIPDELETDVTFLGCTAMFLTGFVFTGVIIVTSPLWVPIGLSYKIWSG